MPENDYVTEYADVCYECGQEDNEDQLFVCDSCDYKICHWYCEPGRKNPPANDERWICKYC